MTGLADWYKKVKEENLCRDCGVKPGEPHEDGCCVARCTECGEQEFMNFCELAPTVWDEKEEDWAYEDPNWGKGQIWTGTHPGLAEAEQYGFYVKWTMGKWPEAPGRWMLWDKPPEEGEENVQADVEAFLNLGYWDKEKQMFQIEEKYLEQAMEDRARLVAEDQAKGLERWW